MIRITEQTNPIDDSRVLRLEASIEVNIDYRRMSVGQGKEWLLSTFWSQVDDFKKQFEREAG